MHIHTRTHVPQAAFYFVFISKLQRWWSGSVFYPWSMRKLLLLSICCVQDKSNTFCCCYYSLFFLYSAHTEHLMISSRACAFQTLWTMPKINTKQNFSGAVHICIIPTWPCLYCKNCFISTQTTFTAILQSCGNAQSTFVPIFAQIHLQYWLKAGSGGKERVRGRQMEIEY